MKKSFVFILFAVSLLFFLSAKVIFLKKSGPIMKDMITASRHMAGAVEVLKNCRFSLGMPLDEETDVNRTGLIGQEYSIITTSIGSLEAKRTTANPDFAALLVCLLNKAGVRQGDTVAIGASNSFPSLIIAALSASKAMGTKPLLICSMGSSQWGANHPEFHWLKMWECLKQSGVFDQDPVAVSLGGERDSGEDMDPRGRKMLLESINESGFMFIDEPDLGRNVDIRVELFRKNAEDRPIKAFINIGGSWANMGTDPEVLRLDPGLIPVVKLSPSWESGLIHEMASQGVPLIHLLFIRGLAKRYGLPWDPVPLPEPGQGQVYKYVQERSDEFLIVACIYILVIIVLLLGRRFF